MRGIVAVKASEEKTSAERAGQIEAARERILTAVSDYWALTAEQPGERRRIPYAGRVYDREELVNLVDSALEFWLTGGRYTREFEQALAEYLDLPFCAFVNSGSSANLLAFMALTDPELGERAIRRGDEVITPACAFPTTVSPIVQFGAVPVFVDIAIPSYNLDARQLEDALSPRTKAVIAAHTLGNPFDLKAVRSFCDRHGLWLVEDNCDALGAGFVLDGTLRKTGTVGHIGTSSFYPPHHITTGEGGAVYTADPLLSQIIRSLRDWGRACACPPGVDNLCGRRFDGQYGTLPRGYDHKYTYSRFGYNLKATDLQAAIGVAQLKKLPDFVEARNRNYQTLRAGLSHLEDRLEFSVCHPDARPSWFGFPITCRVPGGRDRIVRSLEAAGVQTRMLFAGNLIRHPCFDGMRASGTGFRVVSDLPETERAVSDTFWLGVYPGLTAGELSYMLEQTEKAVLRL